MEIGDALAQRGEGQAQHLHPRPLGGRRGQRQLEGVEVPERVVVVVLDIVHDLARLRGIAGGLAAVVQAITALEPAVGGGETVTAKGAGQRQAHQVGAGQQSLALAGRVALLCGVVRVVGQPVEVALARHHVGRTVAHAPAPQRVAAPVTEAGNAAAGKLALRGLHKARPVGHLAEVPALADEWDVAAVVGPKLGLDAQHLGQRLVAHQVEAERVDAVLAGPQPHRVAHQPGHHAVLGGRIGAAGGVGHLTVGQQPVVVAGHDAVQHRLRRLAGGRQVVVDHVHAHPQAGRVQRHHHLPQFAHTDRAVGGAAGVAAFRRIEVQRVVAPVETVAGRAGHHCRLLGQAVGRGGRQTGRAAALLGHAGDVEHGQQVHVAQAGLGQCAQMAHAVAVGLGEGQVLAALGRRHAGVADREVAHLQLVDRHLGHAAQRGRPGCVGPAGGQGCGVVERADPGPLRVQAQADGVGVGHTLAHQALAGHQHVDQVAVAAATQVGRRAAVPDATDLVTLQRPHGVGVGAVVGMQAHRHLPRGGCPQRKAGLALRRRCAAWAQRQAQRWQRAQALVPGRRVKLVQRRRVLHPRGLAHGAAAVLAHQQQLTSVEPAQAAGLGVGACVRASKGQPQRRP